jgi:hypothetical protein
LPGGFNYEVRVPDLLVQRARCHSQRRIVAGRQRQWRVSMESGSRLRRRAPMLSAE